MLENDRIIPVKIDEEMRSSYIDYSMSVIVSRALPDVRDGFKPVHRRVLFGMNELGNTSDKPTKKSARIVGEVMGKYHPHGDSSIYGTLVRMAQPWNMRYPLVDGQGNFGSIDGDGAAAMRYTEARLSKLAEEMLTDIDKETVDMQLNFDDTLREPTVLPCRFPNLLVNGSNGIAVGMATNMPTHNLTEVINGCVAFINREKERLIDNNISPISINELMEYIKAPDFPTGGTIYGYQGVKEAFETGRGRIVIRSNAEIEADNNGREHIIITELPYGVVKSDLVKNIADLVEDKRVDGIADISDQSKRDIRVIIDIKRDANAQVVLNQLFKYTALQSSFSVNNIALVKGRPKLLTLLDMISCFIEHRMDVVVRRTRFELRKAQERSHILSGLIIAVDNIDEVVSIIRSSHTPNEAQSKLEARFALDNLQSKAIVDMRLSALTGLRIEELRKEYADILSLIDNLKDLLSSESLRYDVIIKELEEIKDKYGDVRRTRIVKATSEFNPEDMYADDEMIITISHLGYIKRMPLDEFKSQHRGGIGVRASNTRDEDFVEYMHQASMHSTMMFFTNKGRLYKLRVFEIPEGNRQSKGRAIQNLLKLEKDESIKTFINVKGLEDAQFAQSHYLVFATRAGLIKKTSLQAYVRYHNFGIIAIHLRDGDELVRVALTDGKSEILMASDKGRVVRFNEQLVRPVGRGSYGVVGIRMNAEDRLIGMACVSPDESATVLAISERGFGKRTHLDDEEGNPIYRITNRGGKGVKSMRLNEKTGLLIGLDVVNDNEDIMLITKSGNAIRIAVVDISVLSRNTQGVKLIDLAKRKDTLMFGCPVPHADEKETEEQSVSDL